MQVAVTMLLSDILTKKIIQTLSESQDFDKVF